MLVKEAMNRDVKTIEPEATVKQAAKLMSRERIGSLVVVSSAGIEGIVTERDVLSDVIAEGGDVTKIKVSDIMTGDVITVNSNQSLEDAARLMTENKIKKLPVVDNGVLVGIVTASDLIAYEEKLIEQLASLMVSGPNVQSIGG